jgi:hypothetical protein
MSGIPILLDAESTTMPTLSTPSLSTALTRPPATACTPWSSACRSTRIRRPS